MQTASIDTPMGRLGLVEAEGRITHLLWSAKAEAPGTATLRKAADQLAAYFAGELNRFDLPLEPEGSAFQKSVYRVMQAIPFGQTRTYGEIARSIDGLAQPVGQACGANPIPIIIPCHRVLAADGLGGYSGDGGIETKIALLRHENAYPYLI